MRKFCTAFFVALFGLVSLQAQDKHFTQFYASPLTLNPALTGAFDGRYRIGGIYRDQWRNVLDEPYTTFATSVDVRFPIQLDRRYKDAVAIGLLFYNDDVKGFDFSTNQIALSAAFHKGLDVRKKQFLTLGVQMGIAQRNINYEDLVFDDQFNDLDAFNLATQEDFPENNFSFTDLSVGLNYTFTPKRQTSYFIGVAMHHVLQPQLSFYPTEEGGDSKLFAKYSAQLSASLPIADLVSISPRLLLALQGPHFQANAGTNFRFKFSDYGDFALHLGGWVRPVRNNDDSFDLDAVVFMAGFELQNVLLGLSYDFNLNDLTTTRNGQGAFEISLAYLGQFENDTVLCPKF